MAGQEKAGTAAHSGTGAPRMHMGLVGVGVMGQNLTLNIERHGYPIVVYDRALEKMHEFLTRNAAGKNIAGADSIPEFLERLESPRRIIIMVNAGKPVDSVIEGLRPHLSRGDVLVDAGNSFFRDTERRQADLSSHGIQLVGAGVSGGAEGALHGPSIMPGGPREAYDQVAPVLTAIAAKVNGEACCSYIGPGGSGHYVKMVHNGIEYAIMQVICEVYDLLLSALGCSLEQAADIFERWNATDMNAYLLEITGKVLRFRDPERGGPLVEQILDTAEQKGTGRWTSEDAFALGVPIPTINAAVESRIISGLKEQRLAAAKVLHGPARGMKSSPEVIERLRDALHASMIVSYAQGMALLQAASDEYGYNLRRDEIAALWRGGCIIRAAMLEPIRAAFARKDAPANLMMDPAFSRLLNQLEQGWRTALQTAMGQGIPSTAMAASLNYYDAYRSARLPANLLQAQRDFFGAHTYKRLDREGVFHTEWELGNTK